MSLEFGMIGKGQGERGVGGREGEGQGEGEACGWGRDWRPNLLLKERKITLYSVGAETGDHSQHSRWKFGASFSGDVT